LPGVDVSCRVDRDGYKLVSIRKKVGQSQLVDKLKDTSLDQMKHRYMSLMNDWASQILPATDLESLSEEQLMKSVE